MATQTQVKRNRRRHSRTSSGSFLNSACSRSSSNRTSILVDTETQTDYIDLSEKDISPMNDYASPLFPPKLSTQSQRVILQEIRDGSDSENSNGNAVQLHYMSRHAESGINSSILPSGIVFIDFSFVNFQEFKLSQEWILEALVLIFSAKRTN